VELLRELDDVALPDRRTVVVIEIIVHIVDELQGLLVCETFLDDAGYLGQPCCPHCYQHSLADDHFVSLESARLARADHQGKDQAMTMYRLYQSSQVGDVTIIQRTVHQQIDGQQHVVVYLTISPVSSHPLNVYARTAVDSFRGTGRAIPLAVELESYEIIVWTFATEIKILDGTP